VFFRQAFDDERLRSEHLEEQLNDMMELHQHEVTNIKQVCSYFHLLYSFICTDEFLAYSTNAFLFSQRSLASSISSFHFLLDHALFFKLFYFV